MVKLRKPGSFAGTIARLMEAVGYEALCAELEISKSQLFRFSDEDEPQLPRIDLAYRMDRIASRHGLGTPLFDAYGAKLANADRPAHVQQDALEAVTATIHEVSEAISAYRAATHRPSPVSVTEGLREVAEAAAELDKLRRDLEALLPGAEPLRMVGEGRRG